VTDYRVKTLQVQIEQLRTQFNAATLFQNELTAKAAVARTQKVVDKGTWQVYEEAVR